MNRVRAAGDWPLNSLVRIEMQGDKIVLLD